MFRNLFARTRTAPVTEPVSTGALETPTQRHLTETVTVSEADLPAYRRMVHSMGGTVTSSVFCAQGYYVTAAYPA